MMHHMCFFLFLILERTLSKQQVAVQVALKRMSVIHPAEKMPSLCAFKQRRCAGATTLDPHLSVESTIRGATIVRVVTHNEEVMNVVMILPRYLP